jgi:hypothetical protein
VGGVAWVGKWSERRLEVWSEQEPHPLGGGWGCAGRASCVSLPTSKIGLSQTAHMSCLNCSTMHHAM